ncbi:MAG: hypothetical protein Q8P18_04405 [Pseudomonadota bacterium]|nr:hypothetical protein [Pseudomonadota bacterium]
MRDRSSWRVGLALGGGAQLYWPSFSDVGYRVAPLTGAPRPDTTWL